MKSMTLLGQQIEVLETSGQLLDMQVSKDLKISGGGGSGYTHNGRGGSYTAPIMSTTTTTSKLFIGTTNGEKSVTANGEFNARVGHEISYVTVRHNSASMFLALVNHSLGSWEYTKASLVAKRLSLLPAIPKPWMWAGSAVFLFIPHIGAWITAIFFMGLTLRMLVIWKKQGAAVKQAHIELTEFLQSSYGR